MKKIALILVLLLSTLSFGQIDLATQTKGTLPHSRLPALESSDIPSNAANTSGTAGGLSANIAETQVTGLTTDLAAKAAITSLSTVATTGSYADLSSKPTIPAAQVQTDWNASTGMGVLLNEPTIPTAANWPNAGACTTGQYVTALIYGSTSTCAVVQYSQLGGSVPTWNQNTAGTAAGLSADIIESQVTGLVTDLAAKASSSAATTVNGQSCALGSTCTVADSTKVPTTTTVNGHALSSNVVVSASDLTTGTLPHAQLPTLLSGDIPANGANTSGTAAGLSTNLSGDVTTSGSLVTSVVNVAGTAAATVKARSFGTTFGDTGGSALTAGSTVYFTVPYACTIAAWNIAVDGGTVTFDLWKIASGTAIPTVTNSITASAQPALSTGTAIHSTTMTGWTTAVAANDIFGINLKTVATAKYAEIDIQCNQ